MNLSVTRTRGWLLAWALAPLVSSTGTAADEPKPRKHERVATFAAGCFWCTEAVFEQVEGLRCVDTGYIGGTVPNPTYEQVCDHKTGHAEAVQFFYDPEKVSYKKLLEIFFNSHDASSWRRKFDTEEYSQYRSSIFYHDEEQKKLAEAYIRKLNASKQYETKIDTKLERATKFYRAEAHHQDFYGVPRRAPRD